MIVSVIACLILSLGPHPGFAGAVNVGGLLHDQCLLDFNLAPLAAKAFSIENLLAAFAKPRTCPRTVVDEKKLPRVAYVTPWNPDGYSYTLLHASKLTHVVPVWYQVTLEKSRASLEGLDAIHEKWLLDIRNNERLGIFPRFEVKFASKKDVEAVLFFPRDEMDNIVSCIMKEVERKSYDGATLEIQYVAQMANLIRKLGQALHAKDKQLILVIPAQHDLNQDSPFTNADLVKLAEDVDLFSLNAYDHASSLGQELGNAPLDWTRQILEDLTRTQDHEDEDPFVDSHDTELSSEHDDTISSKLLLGINFYGHTLTKDSVLNTITAKEYSGLLEFSLMSLPMNLEWDAAKAEHKFDGKLWSIWYPTLLSILYRLDLAREHGMGVSIWEAGQGMDHFWDVL